MKTMTTMAGMLAALLLLASGSAQAHHHEWDGYRFEMAGETATQGQPVYFRLVWKNMAKKTVHIPDGLWAKATIRARLCPLSGCRKKYGYGQGLTGKPIAPDKFKWLAMAKGDELERHGSLEEFFPKECKGGCAVGRYVLVVTVSQPNIGPLTEGQVVPKSFVREINIPVWPKQLPVNDPAAIKLKAKFGKLNKKKATLGVVLTVTNTRPWPMWFPKGEALKATCNLQMVSGDGVSGGAGVGFGGSTRHFGESQAVVLMPNKPYKVKTTCPVGDVAFFKLATSITASFNVGRHSYYRFRLTRSRAAVHYFDANHNLPDVKVR